MNNLNGNIRVPILEYKQTILTAWLPHEARYSPPPGEFWTFIVNGVLHAVCFRCPCGCGAECYTPVTPKSEPKQEHYWQYDQVSMTITPSIRYLNGCKAHFNITNGKIVFHGDSGK